MEFKIESGVPIPADARASRTKYPLDRLAVGNSFFVPLNDLKRAKNLRATFSTRAKKKGISIVSIADDTGVRVWRTA
jgi:hypothetical protein